MASLIEPYRVNSPRTYLVRMIIFLVIVGFLLYILQRTIMTAFSANPGLNATIFAVALTGILLAFRQVVRLFPEISWVNGFRVGDPGLAVARQPVLLAPMATMIGDRTKNGMMAFTTQTTRSILESIAVRLDEGREISRYISGLLVFLGLLGTFWGLITTVNSVGQTIQALDVGSGNAGVIFEDLKTGLQAPLSGMGTAFSSSLFGLASSLVVSFLDLQAGQAQNRFYIDLEDWLSSLTEIDMVDGDHVPTGSLTEDLKLAIDRLTRTVADGGSKGSAAHIATLAQAIQGLVTHMREEQQTIRTWAENQGKQQADVKRLLETLTQAIDRRA